MRLTVIGSGTLVPDGGRASPAHFLEAREVRILMDCGSGALHGMERLGLEWMDLTHIVVTHFHTDHVGDLAPLLFAFEHAASERTAPLRILGPPGIGDWLRSLARVHGDFVTDPVMGLEVQELHPGTPVSLAPGLELRSHPTPHTDRSLAVRVDEDGAAVAYTGDTGYADELAAFLDGVDVLLAECALPEERAIDTHLTPTTVARLALQARPADLVLTHVFPYMDPAEVPERVRRAGYAGRVGVARDGLSLEVP